MIANPDRLSATFSALADPTRRAMLSRLSVGELTVKELAAPFDLSPPAVSKHLKVLERSGLITRSRDAQRRPCRIALAPIDEASAWMAQCRAAQKAHLDQLEAYLHTLQSPSPNPDSDV
jgi:DNA-binding transcriptional ArsR family regulator